MTFTCYEPQGMASVMDIDPETGAVTNFSKAPGTYNEPEEGDRASPGVATRHAEACATI
jgi:hypothetical protein